MDPVLSIGLLSGAFLVSHFVLSHPPVRAPLIARLGANGFAGAYSVVGVTLYVPAAWLWWTHRHAGAALWVWRSPVAVHLAEALVASGVALLVAGVAQPSPSSITAPKRTSWDVRGINHVTRHPVLIGSALLAGGHLLVNGWAGDLAFLGPQVVLGVIGALHQDARMVATRVGYADFAARTWILPNPLGLGRVGSRTGTALAVGIGLAIGLRYVHRWF